MVHTPLSHLTDEELLTHGYTMKDIPSELELELLHRLETRLQEEQTCATLDSFRGCETSERAEV